MEIVVVVVIAFSMFHHTKLFDHDHEDFGHANSKAMTGRDLVESAIFLKPERTHHAR